MKKILFLIVFLTIQSKIGVSQDKETLLLKLKSDTRDTARINNLLKLSKHMLTFSGVQKSQIDSAFIFINQAIQLNRNYKNWHIQGQADLQLSLYYNLKGEKEKAAAKSNAALLLFTQKNDLRNQAESYIAIGQCYENEGAEGLKKIGYYRKACDLFQKTGQIERTASTLIDIADLLTFQGANNTLEEIQNLKQAIALYSTINYKKLYGVYDLLGSALRLYGDLVNALRYELLAIKSYEINGDHSLQLCTIYNRTGQCYIGLNNYKQAIDYLLKSLEIAHEFKSEVSVITVSINLSTAYLGSGQYEKAVKILKSIEASPLLNGQTTLNIAIYGKMMLGYLGLKRFDEAKHYFAKIQQLNPAGTKETYKRPVDYIISYYIATQQYKLCYPLLEMNKQIGSSTKIYELNGKNELNWFKVDSALGKYKSAISHFQQYKTFTDSANSVIKNRQIALYNAEFDSERKDHNILMQQKDIEFLKKESELKADKAKADQKLLLGGLGVTILLLGIGYNRFRLKQRINDKLRIQQEEIVRQKFGLEQLLLEKEDLLADKDELLKDKDWLIKEVHHRVKNNLQIVMSLLSSQCSYLENTAALEAIRESQNRVQAISLIHQKLYTSSNVSSINMAAYVSDLVGYLADCFDTRRHRIRIEQLVENFNIDLAQAVPLGLILNEAITNAIKYAFNPDGGEIIIAIHQVGRDGLMLHISDNGCGLPENFDLKNASSLGMEMMKALSKQLGGDFKIRNQSGLHISVEFMIEKVLGTVAS
ncbi:hypothetical protein DYU05_05845 [Mucilaginibacter terrenus]|uniref:histidine kinase n=1 Tax=Mucilaginibacter terrenus TaxID=2482727 RepID=A0A3E2NVV3_9SPHI|nr:histidine kinase dimerization/phosphoacceptor domain -containing protein [Mucilaginibacter terrenus]RFZ85122.1 hypothetical protein DYU05_05845 [Mucilaginibacter terrenus]